MRFAIGAVKALPDDDFFLPCQLLAGQGGAPGEICDSRRKSRLSLTGVKCEYVKISTNASPLSSITKQNNRQFGSTSLTFRRFAALREKRQNNRKTT
jgi:hypothetical protein